VETTEKIVADFELRHAEIIDFELFTEKLGMNKDFEM